jgi:hypothetical protein
MRRAKAIKSVVGSSTYLIQNQKTLKKAYLTMSNLFDLDAARNKKAQQTTDPFYQKRIDSLDMIALLEEMVKYQEQKPKDKELPFAMIRGVILFTALEQKCTTEELRLLAGSYKRHLQHELAAKRSKK